MIAAVVVLLIAAFGVIWVGFLLFKAFVLYRLVDAARTYPHISMALALSTQGHGNDADRFRTWLVGSVDVHGWAGTDQVLSKMLRQIDHQQETPTHLFETPELTIK